MPTASSKKTAPALVRLVLWVGLGLLLGVGVWGCDATDVPDDPEPPGFNGGPPTSGAETFGDGYHILTQHPLQDDPSPPRVRNDSLLVTVGYSGGCKTHTFDLQTDTSNPARGVLWLVHNADDDFCEAYLVVLLRRALPKSVQGLNSLTLLNPNGDPFTLEVSATE